MGVSGKELELDLSTGPHAINVYGDILDNGGSYRFVLCIGRGRNSVTWRQQDANEHWHDTYAMHSDQPWINLMCTDTERQATPHLVNLAPSTVLDTKSPWKYQCHCASRSPLLVHQNIVFRVRAS